MGSLKGALSGGKLSEVKTVMKMGLLHLTYHGNLVQARVLGFRV